MQRICKAVGWLLILVIAVLSLVSPADRPVTGAPHNLEHFGIYVLTGIAFAAAYRDRLTMIVPALIAFCAVVEAAQLWVPGRHARLSDFLVDSAASCAGIAAAAVAERWVRRRPGRLKLPSAAVGSAYVEFNDCGRPKHNASAGRPRGARYCGGA